MIKRLVFGVLSAILITGCGTAETVESASKERFNWIHTEGDLSILQDKETGCKYLVLEGYREESITPLYKEPNQVDCRK